MHTERRLSKKSLDEFYSLYKEEFNEDLTQDDLERKARMLLNLSVSLYSSASNAVRQVQLTDK